MSEGTKKNPVEKRLMLLANHWISFRDDPDKRLLVWQADANALRFYQCFFEVQKHETDYTVGDLFIVFDTPFENTIQYSRELKQSLAGHYEASHEDLVRQGIPPDWQFNPQQTPDSATGVVRSMQSFGSQHHKIIGHLVAVLMPTNVQDNDHFTSWLINVLNANLPERLRFVVIDSMETPRLNRLIGLNHIQVHIGSPQIDALSTAQETFAQENATGPAGVFRNLLIGLMTLVEKGPIEQVKTKAADALKFARKENWPDQETVVTMLVAGAMLKEKQFKEALEEYRNARQAAVQATAAAHPSGQQLELQTWFGEAGVHLAAEDNESAVKCYDHAAVLAQQIPNPILAIESFRMSAFCLARTQQFEPAIQRNRHALSIGERLKPEARPMTTLPIAAVDLLRHIDPVRIEYMDHIKWQQKTHISTLHHNANQKAEALEQSSDPQLFLQVETELEKQTLQVKNQATEQIDAIAAGSNETFQQAFSRGRSLLGTSWPIDTLHGVEKKTSGSAT